MVSLNNGLEQKVLKRVRATELTLGIYFIGSLVLVIWKDNMLP